MQGLKTSNSISVINMDRQATTDHAPEPSSKMKIVSTLPKPNGHAPTPTFHGRRVAASTAPAVALHASTDNDACFKTLENKHCIPLVIGQERLEKMMTSMHANQMKIQRALNKRQVR